VSAVPRPKDPRAAGNGQYLLGFFLFGQEVQGVYQHLKIKISGFFFFGFREGCFPFFFLVFSAIFGHNVG
jgi:hypothetical protein